MLYIYIRLYIFCFFFTCCLLSLFHIVSSSLSVLCPFRTHSQTYLYIHCQRLFHDCASLFSFYLCPSLRGVVHGHRRVYINVCVCSFCACMYFLIVQALNFVLPHFTLAAAQPQLIFRPALRPYEQRPSLRSPLPALSTCIRTYHFLSYRFHLLNFIAIASLFA